MEVDLTVLVEGDLYEGEQRVIPVIIEFMRQNPDLLVDFMILRASSRPEPSGKLIYSR